MSENLTSPAPEKEDFNTNVTEVLFQGMRSRCILFTSEYGHFITFYVVFLSYFVVLLFCCFVLLFCFVVLFCCVATKTTQHTSAYLSFNHLATLVYRHGLGNEKPRLIG